MDKKKGEFFSFASVLCGKRVVHHASSNRQSEKAFGGIILLGKIDDSRVPFSYYPFWRLIYFFDICLITLVLPQTRTVSVRDTILESSRFLIVQSLVILMQWIFILACSSTGATYAPRQIQYKSLSVYWLTFCLFSRMRGPASCTIGFDKKCVQGSISNVFHTPLDKTVCI